MPLARYRFAERWHKTPEVQVGGETPKHYTLQVQRSKDFRTFSLMMRRTADTTYLQEQGWCLIGAALVDGTSHVSMLGGRDKVL